MSKCRKAFRLAGQLDGFRDQPRRQASRRRHGEALRRVHQEIDHDCFARAKLRGGVCCFCQLLLGQFTQRAYGSGSWLYGCGSRLYGRIAEPPDVVAGDCDFTAPLVWDIRLAAKAGPETTSNKPAAIAMT